VTAQEDFDAFNAAADEFWRVIWKQIEPLFRCLCRRWLKA
jgi:hypothetical protein